MFAKLKTSVSAAKNSYFSTGANTEPAQQPIATAVEKKVNRFKYAGTLVDYEAEQAKTAEPAREMKKISFKDYKKLLDSIDTTKEKSE